MALEAFGVASSAAGLISLGLTVCQSLIQYYDSWKDGRSDVARMLVSVEELGKTFQLLRHTLQNRSFDASVTERVNQALLSCQAGVETLRKKLDKIKIKIKSEDRGFRGKVTTTIQRTTYPFKESTLVKLREIVNELRDDLGLALNALQIDTSAMALQKLDMITEGLVPITTSIAELNLTANETNASVNTLIGLSARVTTTAYTIESRQSHEYLLGFYDWLSPLGNTFMTKQHANFGLDNRQEGTWEWLSNTMEFKNWLAAGVGKTVLTSSIVDYLEREYRIEDFGIAYVYCDYNDDRQTAVNLLACILQQLALKNPAMTDTLTRLYNEHKLKGTRLSTSEYCSLLRKMIEGFSRVLVVIDALDECSQRERDRVRDAFLTEIRALQPKVQLLVTSRDIPDIALEFQDAVRLYIRASEEAIANYIAARVDESRNLKRHIRRSPTLRDEIIQTIARKADGMFLLVRMHIDSLATKRVLGDVKVFLNDLPKGLEELDSAYDRVVMRILNQDTDDAMMAKKLLTWLFYAMRPLTLLEAQHAMAIRLGATNLHEDFLPDEEVIISVCAGIVTVEQESKTIAFVHYTTKEYLRRRLDRHGVEIFLLPQAHLAQDCLTYLLFDEFREGSYASKEMIDSRLREYPFLDYAAKNWGNHAHGEIEPTIENLALGFLREEPAMTFSVQIMTRGDEVWGFGRYSNTISELWLASHFGLANLVQLLLDEGADIGMTVSGQETALYRAAMMGHISVVQLLLDKGANIETQCYCRGTALCGAARRGKDGVVKLLVERGASFEARDHYGQTALHRAAEDGQVSAVRLLLESGADVNAKYFDGRTALTWAAGKAHTAVVRLLLENGARVTAEDTNGWNAMHCVAVSSREDLFCKEVIRLLVDNGLDLESKTRDGHTALHLALRFGKEVMVKLLLEMGTKVDSTALQTVAMNGNEELMLLMLAKEADISDTDSRSYLSATRLFRTIKVGPETLMQEHVAEINSFSNSINEMLLLGALKLNNEQLALLLVDKVVDFESKGLDGETALSIAAEKGFLALTNLLLERGADVHAKDEMGFSALHKGVLRGHQNIVKILLDMGAIVDLNDRFGRTALQLAAMNGHEAVVSLLLSKHANIHARDKQGRTALHHASTGGYDTIARLLLRSGANIEAMDLCGRTALANAAMKGSKVVIQLLLEEGANPENVNTNKVERDVFTEQVDFTAAVQMIRIAQDLCRRQRVRVNDAGG